MEKEPMEPPIETSIFQKDKAAWDAIGSTVLAIAHEAVEWNEQDPVYGKTDEDMAYESLEAAFLAEDTTVIIQKNENGDLIGYSLAMPVGKFDTQRAAESDTAYVYMTMIAKEQRGQKRVVPVNTLMMEELQKKGYAFAERDAMYGFDDEKTQKTSGGYPQSIEKGFGNSIVEAYDYTPYPEYGLQRHFRIDIGKFLQNEIT